MKHSQACGGEFGRPTYQVGVASYIIFVAKVISFYICCCCLVGVKVSKKVFKLYILILCISEPFDSGVNRVFSNSRNIHEAEGAKLEGPTTKLAWHFIFSLSIKL